MPLRDLPGYYPEIKDGGLGVLPASLAGLFGVVGNATKGTTSLKFATDPDDVITEYGMGTLVKHLEDAFSAGARQVGIVRSIGDVAGSISAITQKKYGVPTTGGGKALTASGYVSPYTAPGTTQAFILKIITGGSFDEATYKLSANGGATWGDEKKFIVTTAGPPRKAKIDLGNGTYIEFTEDATPADSFDANDQYRWTTTEPRSSLDEIIAACERAAAWKDSNTGYGLEYIYVASIPSSIWSARTKANITAFWAALATIAENIWNQEYRPIWFMCNAPYMLTDGSEEIDDWLDLLEECSTDYRHNRLCVIGGYSMQVDKRGNQEVRPIGGSAAGLVSKAKLHQSIGWVRYMAIPNSIAVYPYKPEVAIADEALGTGNGTKKLFEGFLVERPVSPWSVTITSDDTVPEEFVDGGNGILYDSTAGTVAGSIDYETGKYSVTFATAPATGKIVSASYLYTSSDDMDLGNAARLNDNRFVGLRQWIGYGRVAVDDWMMAPPTSDYSWIRYRRIVDEAVRVVGAANVPYVNSPGIAAKDMAAYQADLERPLRAMLVTEADTDKPIMAFKLTLTPDENIWSNGIVHAKIEIVPTPTKKKLEAVFQLTTAVES